MIELDRAVDANGTLTLAATKLALGSQLARTRVTLRLDGHLVHVIQDGALAKILSCPIPPDHASPAARRAPGHPAVTPPPATPIHLGRRVPVDGVVMVTRQRLAWVAPTPARPSPSPSSSRTPHLRVLHNGEELSLHPATAQNRSPVSGPTHPAEPANDHVKHVPRPSRPVCPDTTRDIAAKHQASGSARGFWHLQADQHDRGSAGSRCRCELRPSILDQDSAIPACEQVSQPDWHRLGCFHRQRRRCACSETGGGAPMIRPAI